MLFERVGITVDYLDLYGIRSSHRLKESFRHDDAGNGITFFNEFHDLFLRPYLVDVYRVLDAVHLLDEIDSQLCISFVIRDIACDRYDAVRFVFEKKFRRIHDECQQGKAER